MVTPPEPALADPVSAGLAAPAVPDEELHAASVTASAPPRTATGSLLYLFARIRNVINESSMCCGVVCAVVGARS